MNNCTTCGTTENLFVYSKKKDPDGVVKAMYYMCRGCNTARCRRYRQTNYGKYAIHSSNKGYRIRNPERVKAWRVARILEKKPCVICGKEPSHKHHPDIKRPLFVIYLCPRHHTQAHKNTS